MDQHLDRPFGLELLFPNGVLRFWILDPGSFWQDCFFLCHEFCFIVSSPADGVWTVEHLHGVVTLHGDIGSHKVHCRLRSLF